MKKFIIILILLWPFNVFAGEKEDLQAKLENIRAQRQQLLIEYKYAQTLAELDRIKDIELARSEKEITDRLQKLAEKPKPKKE